MTISELEDAIHAWVVAASGLAPERCYFSDRGVRVSEQEPRAAIRIGPPNRLSGPRPAETMTYDASRPMGQELENTVRLWYSVVVDVQTFAPAAKGAGVAPPALELAMAIAEGLELESIRDALNVAGVGVLGVAPVARVPAVVGALQEDRAIASVTLTFQGTRTERLGYIARVQGTATLSGLVTALDLRALTPVVPGAWAAWLMASTENLAGPLLDYSGNNRHLDVLEPGLSNGLPSIIDSAPGLTGKARRFTRAGEATTSPFAAVNGVGRSLGASEWLDLVLGTWTFAAWVRRGVTVSSGGFPRLFEAKGWGPFPGTRDGGILINVSRTTARVQVIMQSQAGGGGTQQYTMTATYAMTTGVWTHLTFVKRPLDVNGFMSFDLYVNGNFQEKVTASITGDTAFQTDIRPVEFGDLHLACGRNTSLVYPTYSMAPHQAFEGDLAQVVVYSRDLSSGEVGFLATANPPPP